MIPFIDSHLFVFSKFEEPPIQIAQSSDQSVTTFLIFAGNTAYVSDLFVVLISCSQLTVFHSLSCKSSVEPLVDQRLILQASLHTVDSKQG